MLLGPIAGMEGFFSSPSTYTFARLQSLPHKPIAQMLSLWLPRDKLRKKSSFESYACLVTFLSGTGDLLDHLACVASLCEFER